MVTMIDRRVLFYGDSFVAGIGDPEGIGWVGRVVAAAAAANLPLTPHNAGIRGATSVDVVALWRGLAEPQLDPVADCRVVFSFGANDATFENGEPRVQPEQTLDALMTALEEADELELPAFVVGPPPANDLPQRERIAALSDAFAEECAVRGVPYVAVVDDLHASAVWRDEARADGAHPSTKGYELLAGLVLDGGWLDWLRSDAAR